MTQPPEMDNSQVFEPWQPIVYAGFWWRWLAMFIDRLILFCPGFLLGMMAGFLCRMTMPNLEPKLLQLIAMTMGSIWGVILSWLYFASMEASSCQATIGKMICKLQVTDQHGNRLTFARATGRYFSKFISDFTCLVGFIMAAFTEKKQALHDMIASTYVIKKNG